MSGMDLLGLVLAIAVGVYLLIALIRAESF
jgi:K+-transporting ATPase KdpF subunit